MRCPSQVYSLVLVWLVSPANAVNLAFMPGDAYFVSWLSGDTKKALLGSDLVFEYGHSIEDMAFCGYAGFQRLRITGDTVKLKAVVRPVLAAIGQAAGDKQTEPKHRLFIYNRDLDWSTDLTLGLRYNQHWDDLPDEAFDSEKRKVGGARARAERYMTLDPSEIVRCVSCPPRWTACRFGRSGGIPEHVSASPE